MTAGFEAITSTRVARLYGMYLKLCGVVVQGEQSSFTLMRDDKHYEHANVLVQAQLH